MIYSENFLNRQQAAVINGIAFDSTNREGSDENKIEELTHTIQNCQTSKSETFVETNTHLKLLCCKRQKPEVDDRSKKKHDQLKKGFLLAVAYSSSIDGLSSLVGTASSAYLKDFVETHITDGTATIFCEILPLILPDSNPFNPWRKSLALNLGVPRAAASIIIIIVSRFFTEVTSNTSTFSIFLSALDSVATSAGIRPAFLIFPCTLTVSLAFMVPIATPPSAIVFASGAIRVIDMIETGILMNLIGFFVIFIAANT
ncbi:unnamed protein product [Rotaria magnacalcarata]|uniref:Uncharacterized protein n=1 Tax=Rotaria magnacalcarata TaxID=392030 RepID=A0A8S2SJT7_9BILA|nr:unnamed protein product [Rotaria magnacalcarata]